MQGFFHFQEFWSNQVFWLFKKTSEINDDIIFDLCKLGKGCLTYFYERF